MTAAEGPGARATRPWYHFENVFDWRSGPRRGHPTAPTPIHPLALTGPRIAREGLVRSIFPLSFAQLGLTPELLRAVVAAAATPNPPPSSARRSRSCSPAATCSPAPRPAPARRPPSCCRCCRASPPRARLPARPAATHPRPGPRPDPRARDPGRGERPHLRRHRPVRSTAIYGGVGFGQPARRAAPRPPRSWSPRRAGCSTMPASGRSTSARSRSSSSTRPTACSTWASSATSATSSRCCRRGVRTSSSAPPSRTRSARSPTGCSKDPASVQVTPAQHAARPRRAGHPPGRPRAKARAAQRTSCAPGRIDQALVFTRTKHGADRLAEQLNRDGIAAVGHPRQQEPAAARARARRLQGRPRHAAGRDGGRRARPRHRGSSRTSSTSSCRWCRPTTSIASAAPAAPARRRRDHRSSASTRRRCCATSSACSGIRSRSEVIAGFEPDRSIRPEPIRMRSGGGQRRGGPSPARHAAGRGTYGRPQGRRPRRERPTVYR